MRYVLFPFRWLRLFTAIVWRVASTWIDDDGRERTYRISLPTAARVAWIMHWPGR